MRMCVILHTTMRAVILILWFPPKTPQPTQNRFSQKFYGQDVSTWGGKYEYRRRGILDDLPHRKLRRGVVVLRERDREEVEEFLGRWDINHEIRAITPTEEDAQALSARTPS